MGENFNKLAEWIADKVGSPLSILIHTIFFILNLLLMLVMDVNRVLLILTTWVSLEAIYLALLTQLVVTNEKKRKENERGDANLKAK
jgi:hypothetical protein